MIVEFKMNVNDEIIEFKSIGKLDGNVLSFKDRNNKDNLIKLYLLEDQVILSQEGITSMENTHILNKKTNGFYKGMHGVDGITNCFTKELIIKEKEVYIEYDFYFNGNLASNNILLIKY